MTKDVNPSASALGKKSAERFKDMTSEQKTKYFQAIRAGNKGVARDIHKGVDERS
jgi:hypothetical protein